MAWKAENIVSGFILVTSAKTWFIKRVYGNIFSHFLRTSVVIASWIALNAHEDELEEVNKPDIGDSPIKGMSWAEYNAFANYND